MSRKIGDKLEKEISEEMGINMTTNSGAKWGNADLANSKVLVEAKVKDHKKTLGGFGSELKKLRQQAEKLHKEWIYVQQNQGGRFVILDWNFFLEMWDRAHKAE